MVWKKKKVGSNLIERGEKDRAITVLKKGEYSRGGGRDGTHQSRSLEKKRCLKGGGKGCKLTMSGTGEKHCSKAPFRERGEERNRYGGKYKSL